MNIIETSALIPTPTGDMRTALLTPKDPGKYPTLILYSEIFQLTGPIMRSAAIIAGHGFIVAVPEVYHEHLDAGTVLGYDDAGKDIGNELKNKTRIESYDEGVDAEGPLPVAEALQICEDVAEAKRSSKANQVNASLRQKVGPAFRRRAGGIDHDRSARLRL